MAKESKNDKSSLLFVGCLFLGIGFGFVTGNQEAGVLIGMGAGFLAMWFTKNK